MFRTIFVRMGQEEDHVFANVVKACLSAVIFKGLCVIKNIYNPLTFELNVQA